jgi:peptidoglycan/LPS O-acetylase OafA/YrhL
MSNSARITALDGVRGLATLMVLESHFLFNDTYNKAWWYPIPYAGWLGVDLFFILSGFLITGILLHTKTRAHYFRDFYRRRILRIFPLYYAVLLFAVFAILVIDRQPEHLWNGYDSLAWFFAFIPNVALALKGYWVWQTNWAGLNHLWSLAVEEQFYLIWPLVVFLLPRKALLVLCLVLLGSAEYLRDWTNVLFDGPWVRQPGLAGYVLPFSHMDGLAAGSLLAILVNLKVFKWDRLEYSLIRDLTFLSGMFWLYWLVTKGESWRISITVLFFSGLVYLALAPFGFVRSFFNGRFLRHLGMYSYALYVFHKMFWQQFEWHIRAPLMDTGMPVWLVQIFYMLACFGITYVLARLSWRFIEQPFLKLKDKWGGSPA